MRFRLANLLMVFALVVTTNAACLCWVQMLTTTPSCHVSEEMKDCCCSQKTKLNTSNEDHDFAVMPAGVHLIDVDLVVSFGDDTPVKSSQKFLSERVSHRNIPLRSPPDLYVLHTTYLI